MKIKSKVSGKIYRGRTIPTEFITLSNPEATFGTTMAKIMVDFKADNDIIIDGETAVQPTRTNPRGRR